MASLPRQVGQLEFPLDERDQAALISAAARMRREDDQWYPGAFGGFHDVLDGAIAWLAHAPDLITALRDCGPRQDCQAGAVGAAADWCERVPQRCVQTFDRERLDAVAGLIGDRTWASHNLERIRRIAGETRVSESPGQ
jgi:hypothetical protein